MPVCLRFLPFPCLCLSSPCQLLSIHCPHQHTPPATGRKYSIADICKDILLVIWLLKRLFLNLQNCSIFAEKRGSFAFSLGVKTPYCMKVIPNMLNAMAHQRKMHSSKEYLIIGSSENIHGKVYSREQMLVCLRKM